MSVVTVTNKNPKRKKTAITRQITSKVKQIIGVKTGKYAHKLYPNKYFRAIWFTFEVFTVIYFFAQITKTTVKEAAERLVLTGYKKEMGERIGKQLDDPTTQESIRLSRIVRCQWRLKMQHPLDFDLCF